MSTGAAQFDFIRAVLEAVRQLPIQGVAPIDGGMLVYPTGENPIVAALQVVELAEGAGVLNVAVPLIGDPVTSAVARLCANNGARSALAGAAMFQLYEGVDGRVYLAAVVRMPMTAAIWQSGQLAHIIAAAMHSVAMHHDHFASFVEFCEATGQPYGRELYPACDTGYPRPVITLA